MVRPLPFSSVGDISIPAIAVIRNDIGYRKRKLVVQPLPSTEMVLVADDRTVVVRPLPSSEMVFGADERTKVFRPLPSTVAAIAGKD